MKNYIISTLLIFCFSITAIGQTSFGLRTGLNFNTLLSDDLEEGENFGTNTGFHIGLAFNRQFTDIWGVRAELVYSQKGGRYAYDGISSAVFKDRNDRAITHSGVSDIDLSVNNSYLDIPLSGYARVSSWLEVSLGIAPGFLVGSKGRGDFILNSNTLKDEVALGLIHRYISDDAGEPAEIPDLTEETITVQETATAKELTIPSKIAAYTFQDEKNGNLYNLFNLDAVFGISVYVNKGLFIGGRVHYGLLDVSNDVADFSFENITTLRSDTDVNLVFQGSVGFNF